MDEEIDLRPYIQGLISHWWVPVLVAAVSALAALALNLLRPDAYETSAMVVITEPGQRVSFDPRFEVNERPDELLFAYPELALSDDVLKAVLDKVKDAGDGKINSVGELRGLLNVNVGKDPHVLYLTARNGDPAFASAAANAWARQFVDSSNQIYGNQGGQVDYYNSQLEAAREAAAFAEQALTDYQQVNRLTVATNLYNSLSQQQIDYLTAQRGQQMALEDIALLQKQIRAGTGENSFADQYAALTLQLRVFNEPTSANPVAAFAPPQFLIDNEGILTTADRQEQLRLLGELAASIQAALADTSATLAAIEPQLLQSQREVQEATAELTRLTIARDVANETVMTVGRRLDEEKLTSGSAAQPVRLGSHAATPESPAGGQTWLTMVIAGVLGFLVGAFFVILSTWWSQFANRRRDPAGPTTSTTV